MRKFIQFFLINSIVIDFLLSFLTKKIKLFSFIVEA